MGNCERCGAPIDNPRHTRICKRVPIPRRMVAMLESGEYSPKMLAARYDVSHEFIVDRLSRVGVCGEDLKRWAGNEREVVRCLRCDIIIIAEPTPIHPTWKMSIQADVDGLCPGCHIYTQTGKEPLLSDAHEITSVFSLLSVR